jgi:hypothetical protein
VKGVIDARETGRDALNRPLWYRKSDTISDRMVWAVSIMGSPVCIVQQDNHIYWRIETKLMIDGVPWRDDQIAGTLLDDGIWVLAWNPTPQFAHLPHLRFLVDHKRGLIGRQAVPHGNVTAAEIDTWAMIGLGYRWAGPTNNPHGGLYVICDLEFHNS